jgi:hypothetical protein
MTFATRCYYAVRLAFGTDMVDAHGEARSLAGVSPGQPERALRASVGPTPHGALLFGVLVRPY